jgi:hypothetical protein
VAEAETARRAAADAQRASVESASLRAQVEQCMVLINSLSAQVAQLQSTSNSNGNHIANNTQQFQQLALTASTQIAQPAPAGARLRLALRSLPVRLHLQRLTRRARQRRQACSGVFVPPPSLTRSATAIGQCRCRDVGARARRAAPRARRGRRRGRREETAGAGRRWRGGHAMHAARPGHGAHPP